MDTRRFSKSTKGSICIIVEDVEVHIMLWTLSSSKENLKKWLLKLTLIKRVCSYLTRSMMMKYFRSPKCLKLVSVPKNIKCLQKYCRTNLRMKSGSKRIELMILKRGFISSIRLTIRLKSFMIRNSLFSKGSLCFRSSFSMSR